MERAWAGRLGAFVSAAEWFVGTAAAVDDRWAEPGLGEWDVRALVGHTSRAMLTVETYLAAPAERVDVESATLYYRAARSGAGGAAVAQRGRDAGQALGPDPASAVADIAQRVIPLVQRCTGDELLTTIAGGMRLVDYLPTRTFELVVHTCDLATALGLRPHPPVSAMRSALALAAELVLDEGRGPEVLLALTGRRALPTGYTLV
jgi:uncharacterized protein (TIGR03083 family)